jgi:hypothetical protein
MNTLTTAYNLSLIPGAVLSRLTYRRGTNGGDVSKGDVVFMLVTSYALYAWAVSEVLSRM